MVKITHYVVGNFWLFLPYEKKSITRNESEVEQTSWSKQIICTFSTPPSQLLAKKWYRHENAWYKLLRSLLLWYSNGRHVGSGGGASGSAMALCLGWPSSNLRTDLGFFQIRIAVYLCSQGVGLFLMQCNGMVHTLPSSFLFPTIIHHCKIYQLQ